MATPLRRTEQIRTLIKEIKHRGAANADGRHQITFKELFEQTGNVFDALSGICRTARKYGVIAFEGEQLWQGTAPLPPPNYFLLPYHSFVYMR